VNSEDLAIAPRQGGESIRQEKTGGARVRMGLPFRVMRPPGLMALSVVAAALAGITGLELRDGAQQEVPVPATPSRRLPPVA